MLNSVKLQKSKSLGALGKSRKETKNSPINHVWNTSIQHKLNNKRGMYSYDYGLSFYNANVAKSERRKNSQN